LTKTALAFYNRCMNRRTFTGVFSSLFASVATASATVTGNIRQAFGGHKHIHEIDLETSRSSSVRLALWLRIEHSDGVRFKVGTPGEETLASGVIAPSASRKWCDYQVLSIKGLNSPTPIRVTLTSKKPFQLLGLQEVFDKPYEVRSSGEYAKVDTCGCHSG
jgi:hypothetical protein